MARRVRSNRNHNTPELIQIPIFIPTGDGVGEFELGVAQFRGDTMLVNLNNSIASQAIKHRIQRGELVGLTFVIPEDEADAAEIEEAERAKRIQEEADQAKLDDLKERLSTEDPGN